MMNSWPSSLPDLFSVDLNHPLPQLSAPAEGGGAALSYCVSLLTSETAMLLLLLLLQTVRTFMLLLL